MTDSGHISASITTTEYMLNNLNIFWGVGLNQQIKWTPGATGGYSIHDVYTYVWVKYGLYMTIYLLIIIGILMRKIYLIMKPSKRYSSNYKV